MVHYFGHGIRFSGAQRSNGAWLYLSTRARELFLCCVSVQVYMCVGAHACARVCVAPFYVLLDVGDHFACGSWFAIFGRRLEEDWTRSS